MPYRAPGVRDGEPQPERPRATFEVRHRSGIGLVLALLVAAGAVAFGVSMMLAPGSRALAPIALSCPMILFVAAMHQLFELAAEVVLVVEGIPEKGIMRVTLRRRWGLLPWSAPLEFDAAAVPSLTTKWETGRSSSKYGRGREYKHASLVLDVQGSTIPLPAMRGSRRVESDIVIVDHAPVVQEAIARYEAGAASLRKALGKTTKRARRKARERAPGASRLLVASTEGAFGPTAAGALALGITASVLLALAAHLLPGSNVAFVCSALVLPVFGGIIALVAAASTKGATLHFERRGAGGSSVSKVHDLFLFGPVGAAAPRALGPDLEFYVKEIAATEDTSTRYAIVDAGSGETLFVDEDESAVKRFGDRIAGRRIDPPSSPP